MKKIILDEKDLRLINKKTKIKIFITTYLICFVICLIFYKNILLSMIMSFGSIFIYQRKCYEKINQIKNEILYDFKEFINLFLSSTLSGNEPCKAFLCAYDEFVTISKNESFMLTLTNSRKTIEMFNDFEQAIKDINEQYNIDEIERFYDSISIASMTMGNIASVVEDTVDIISERIQTQCEIEKIFFEKKYELKIMLYIPVLLYLILSVTASDFIGVIYSNIMGYIVLTLCLLLIISAYLLGEYMMDSVYKNRS